MQLHIDIDQEVDGRWISEVPDLPGVLAYGETRQAAISRVQALALRVMADRIELGESSPRVTDAIKQVFSVAA
jgi:predicted RNase H-like HicB family nuclease